MPLPLSALVRNTRLPWMTGDEWPVPGSGAFQLKSDSVNRLGTDGASIIPVPFGPRKRVHSCEAAGEQDHIRIATDSLYWKLFPILESGGPENLPKV